MMMMAALRGRLPLKLKYCIFDSLPYTLHHQSEVHLVLRLRSLSSVDVADAPPSMNVGNGTSNRHFVPSPSSGYQDDGERISDRAAPRKIPPQDPIPNRPWRADSPISRSQPQQPPRKGRNNFNRGGGGGAGKPEMGGHSLNRTGQQLGGIMSPPRSSSVSGGKNEVGNLDFLEKFKLTFDKEEKQKEKDKQQVGAEPRVPPPQDADEIFKKMKETGLIPNAVAMLHGLCQDGLVQEAMKLFGLMREKGTIPEVVIYTAVVEGFCKAQKLEDAKRIFRKMQNNGISPNAFSYAILIQGLYQNKSLDDALDLCVEMLESGHSPNPATFVGLVDGFCREKGLEEAQRMIGTLRQKGFFFDEKVMRQYLDKKGPFLQLVWDAILGKKSSEKPF